MKQTVVGLFNKSSEAQQAVQQLTQHGFSDNMVDISIGSTANDTTTGNTDFALGESSNNQSSNHESGVTRFFKNLFGNDDDTNANRYSKSAMKGNSIVTVHAESEDEAERAADILDDNGAISVDEDAEGYDQYNTGAAPVGLFNETAGASAGTVDTDTTTGNFVTDNDDNTLVNDDNTLVNDRNNITGKTSIPIIEEELQVGKRTVETGGVRLKSRIIERPVEEDVRLREERVYVNRTSLNRPATEADFNSFKEGETEMKEHAEVPVISKEARIVEEVSLAKESNERSETIRDTVRKTEVDVENIDGSATKSTDTYRKDN